MELIDTHCHLTQLSEEELDAQIQRARQVGVTKAICIGAGYGIADAFKATEIAESKANIWCSVGIHPHDSKEIDNFRMLC